MADGDDDDLDLDPKDLDESKDQLNDQQDAGDDDQQDQDQPDQDEPGAGDQPDLESRPQPQQQDDQRPASRRDRRIETLTDSIRQRDQQLSDLNRRVNDLLQQRSQPQETPEQRNARLASLTPEERISETLAEDRRLHRQEMQQLQMQVAEGSDRAAFEARCSPGTIHAKWKDRVEQELVTMRQQGFNAPRDKVLAYLLGKAMLDRQGSGENRQQRRQAETRLRRQTTRPAANGSDTRADRGRQTSLERRLENVEI
jgi:hypothetical protein